TESLMRADEAAIASPCEQDWDRMRPEAGGRRRWCDHCERQVHNLSRMSEPAARALLGAMAGSDLCVAYYQDEAGEIVFAPEAEIVPLERVRRRPVIEAAMLVSAASLALLLGACTTYGEEVEALRVDDEPAVMVTAPPTTVVPLALADPPAPANLV